MRLRLRVKGRAVDLWRGWCTLTSECLFFGRRRVPCVGRRCVAGEVTAHILALVSAPLVCVYCEIQNCCCFMQFLCRKEQ